MKDFTFEQLVLLVLLAVGMLLQALRNWDARRRRTEAAEVSFPEHAKPEPPEEGDQVRLQVASPPAWEPRTLPAPPRPRPTTRSDASQPSWLALPADVNGWRQAIVLMTLLGPPRACDPTEGSGARGESRDSIS